MKAPVILSVLLVLVSGCSYLPPVEHGAAAIEFERRENNGLINVVPCTVVLDDYEGIALRGGERGVVSVRAGGIYVSAFSIDPYSAHSDKKAWRSPRVRFQISNGERLRILIEPASSGSMYTGGWTMHAAQDAPHKAKNEEQILREHARRIEELRREGPLLRGALIMPKGKTNNPSSTPEWR